MDLRLGSPDNSLDAPLSHSEEEGLTQMDMLVDNTPLQDERVESAIDGERHAKWLSEALKLLNQRELHVIQSRRFGDKVATLEALGEELGVTKERVRQIEVQALEKLRTALTRDHGKTLNPYRHNGF